MLVFRPAVTILNRLKFPQKFGLISLLLALPLLYVLQQFLREVGAGIGLANKERKGVAYARPLRHLLEPLSAHQRKQAKYRSAPSFLWKGSEQEAQSQRNLQALDIQEQVHGRELQTARAYHVLRNDWRACMQSETEGRFAQSCVLHDKLRSEVVTLLSHVGDTSTLILDPDLDSYYTMNAVVVDLPACADLIIQARNLIEASHFTAPLTSAQQAHFLVLAGQLQQSTTSVAHDNDVSFHNNPSGFLRPTLNDRYSDVALTNQVLIRLLADCGSSQTYTPRDLALLRLACSRAQAANIQLWDSAVDALDRLLARRAAIYAQRKTHAELFALGMLLLVTYLYAAFYLTVMRTVSSLEAASRRMSSGDMHPGALPASESRDELAQVVRSFNTVAARLYHEWKQAQEDSARAVQAEERYRAIVENAGEGIFQTTVEGRYLSANSALARIYGYSSPAEMMEALIAIETQLYVDSSRRADFSRLLEANHTLSNFESEVWCKDGSKIWIAENARIVRDATGETLYYEGSAIDITQRKRAEQALLASKERYRSVVEQVKEVIFTTDTLGHWTFLNPAWTAITGYPVEESLGQSLLHFVHEEDRVRHWSLFEPLLQREKDYSRHEIRFCTRNGEVCWVEAGIQIALDAHQNPTGFFGTLTDITERKRAEEKLHHLALHDALTNLPNRLLFQDRLRGALSRAERAQTAIAVLFVDLDNFKVINDSMGHEAGDTLLRQIAVCLQGAARREDTIARLGGDEFTLLLEGLHNVEGATRVAENIVTQLQQPLVINEREVFASASIGIVYSDDGTSLPEDLLRDADTAMYQAKTGGKSGYTLFDPSMNVHVTERLEIETGLRFALDREELRLHYQPLINLETGRMSGAEALVRWQHSTLGMIAPGRFIPIAEETGLIIPIGYWVLEQACRQMQAWKTAHPNYGSFTVNVNLSGKQLLRADVVERVREILARTKLAPSDLKLEITESVMMADVKDVVARLTQLKALGVKLAMDDFGTGYSSIASLNLFPLDAVKIDRSFVAQLAKQEEAQSVIAAIMMLSKALNLNITGEGIETKEQLEYLQGLGCQIGQGYYFAKPLPPEILEERMADTSCSWIEMREQDGQHRMEDIRKAA